MRRGAVQLVAARASAVMGGSLGSHVVLRGNTPHFRPRMCSAANRRSAAVRRWARACFAKIGVYGTYVERIERQATMMLIR
jgi:hypothetical protein